MLSRAAALFVAAASLVGGAACADELAVPTPVELMPGGLVAGTMVVASFGPVVFSESLALGGLLIGRAGPPSDPERWSWSGTWKITGDLICRTVRTTNSVACLTLRQDARGATMARPAGKLGDGNTARVEARLFPGNVALHNWTVPAAVVLALRERMSP